MVIFASLMIGASLGDTGALVPPDIGIYALLVGLAHVAPLYVAFGIRTWKYYDIRINPYISLVEFLFHGKIGVIACLVEIGGQVLGAVIASASAYGVLQNSPAFLAGVGHNLNHTSPGWAFWLETFAGTFMGWVYFHNWYHEHIDRMPISMAYVVSMSTAIVYPFIGPTTHNPFRWLSACVIEGTCSTPNWWVFVFGPGAGVLLGFLIHLVTWNVSIEDFKKKSYI